MNKVSEDLSLIEHVRNAFWEIVSSADQSMSSSPVATEKEAILDDHDIALEKVVENLNSIALPFDDLQILRRDTVNGSCSKQHSDRQLVDDDEFNCDLHYPSNSNEFISHYFAETTLSPSINLILSDTVTDNSHYAKTLATILRNSMQVAKVPAIPKSSTESSFRDWHSSLNARAPTRKTNRNMPKRVLVDLSWAPGGHATKSQGKNATGERGLKSEGDDAGANHVLSERRRREKLNEKFITLRSLLPSISKVDKASILTDTIEYVKELERRVEESECYRASADIVVRAKRKNTDIAEGTSDNYGNRDVSTSRNPSKKTKFSAIDEREIDSRTKLSKDVHGSNKVNVTLVDNEVLVHIYCPWRACLLLKVIEAVNSIQLDAHSVQSSVTDGFFSLTLRAMIKGSTMPYPGMIKRTLQRILSMC